MMHRSILFLFIVMLLGCTGNKDKNNTVKKNTTIINAKTILRKAASSDTLARYTGPDDTVPKVIIPEGTIQVLANNQPEDTINRSYLLETVLLEGDEIDLSTEMKLQWKGLFTRKNGTAYIKDVHLKFERAESETDTAGQKTGWTVKSDSKGDAYFLSGINGLTDGPIQRVKLTKDMLYPGEKQEFTYNGVDYTFYAKGFKKDGDIYNYKLFLLANVKGHYFNQLLASEEHFGDELHWEADATISIAFVGDIDGDKIPDIVISRAAEFEGDSQLFLSKSAGNNAILKHVTGFGQSD